jgi:predicted negative regulator of RcsB-dependent stress response
MQYAHTLSRLANQQSPDAQAWGPLIAELKSLCEQYRGTRAARTAQVDLAQAYLVTGQYDQAIAWDLKNLNDLKANPAAQMITRHRLVMSYRAMNRLDEALAECAALQGLAVPGFSREVQWLLGQLFTAKHEPDKAVEHFRKALEMEGTFPADGILQEGLTQAQQMIAPRT